MTKTIIRQITPELHTFSRPFSRFGLLKIGNRATVLTLADGTLAIISPVDIREDRSPVDYIHRNLGGRVRLIIAPDLAHWLHVAAWLKEFPTAKAIGVEGHDQKTKGQGVAWDTLFTSQTDPAEILRKYNVQQDLDFCYFPGFVGKDLVVLHRRSRSIVEADLVFNLPAKEQYNGQSPRGLTALMNVLRCDSVWSRRFLWYIGKKDEKQMRQSSKTVHDWNFDNLIPCHGDVILGNAKQAWDWIFDKFLQ